MLITKASRILKICLVFISIYLPVHAANIKQNGTYQATHESISTHPLSNWYKDAKFGIMITYGLYSIPGWAPLYNPIGKVMSKEFLFNNPYAEWYLNSMSIKDSPTYQYHLKTYGANFKYDDFIPLFNTALNSWDPDKWSALFETSGAKYVVLITKHSDGFLLWPSQYHNPYKSHYEASRDIVGELTESVRKHHMHMGLYYSGGYDWTWPDGYNLPITDIESAIKRIPQSQEYADYVDHHWHELIEKYHPDLLWNDVALPQKVDRWKLFADYYNSVPEGVINNRWNQGAGADYSLIGQADDKLIDLQRTYDWFDYYSPEYLPSYHLTKNKWEADHGPGYSFGYNRLEFESPDHFKTLDELIIDLADLVSKNGNLMLAISPEADGTIPELEKNLLLGIGAWLEINGESIYSTKPWIRAEGSANNGDIPVRFTQSKNEKYLYVILLSNPAGQDVVINNLPIANQNAHIDVLNEGQPIQVKWKKTSNDLMIILSKIKTSKEHPLVLRIQMDNT